MKLNYKNIAIVLVITVIVSMVLCAIGAQIFSAQAGFLVGFICQVTKFPMFE
jgi:hypothetical protein